jgi:hypothetical protein
MSHAATLDLSEPSELKPIPLPAEIFAQWQVTISMPPNTEFPPFLPQSFVLVPDVVDGNIQLTVQDVQYSEAPLNPPVWMAQEAILHQNPDNEADNQVSITMKSSAGDLLLLSGKQDGNSAEGTWASTLVTPSGGEQGTWEITPGANSSFNSAFSWSFLLAPSGGEDPITVILNFNITVGQHGMLCQQSSFPRGWIAQDFGDQESGIFFTLVDQNTCETYSLQKGLFVGKFGALVCQGKLSLILSDGPECDQLVDDGGTWTGTSGGPMVVMQR